MNATDQLTAKLTREGKVPSGKKGVVVGGMGGSRLPAEFFRAAYPDIPLSVWKSYGLPPDARDGALYIASSYSGNTEETLSFFDDAHAAGYKVSVITGGGELLARAQEAKTPFIQIPWHAETPARRMLPVALRALALSITKEDSAISDGFGNALRVGSYERGTYLSGSIPVGSTPVFYASERNSIIAEYAKIEVSETAHTPAYASTVPEFLHNELASFAREKTHIAPIFFFDSADDERVVRDMRHAMRFLEKKGYTPAAIELKNTDRVALLAEACLIAQGIGDALLRDRVPTDDYMREFRKEV